MVENHIFKHDWSFRHYVFINNPHLQSREIIIFLRKYYIVIWDTLIGPFLDVLFLLLSGILSELREKPRRKHCVTENSLQKNCFERNHLFGCASSFLCLFVAFFIYSLFLPKWRTCGTAPIKIYSIAMGDILCEETINERLRLWKSPTIYY